MVILKLLLIFVLVMAVISRKKPIYLAISAATILAWLLYAVPFADGLSAVIKGCFCWDTISLIFVVYVISLLQSMMLGRNAIERARLSVSSLFNNRWVDCAAVPIFIGMLPTPNAAFIAGDIVKASAGDCLDNDEKAVVTSYFRHVSESFMPTYNSILTALVLSGIAAGDFVLAMLPIVAVIIISGCFWLLRGKVPMSTGHSPSSNRRSDILGIFIGLWPILLIIILVVSFKFHVWLSSLIAVAAYFLVHRFSFSEIKPMFKEAVQINQYLNIITIMSFKELLAASGAVDSMTAWFSALPLPSFLVFAIMFFFGSIVSGSTAMIVLCLPLAMATVPDAGVSLLALLMGVAYAAMQLSPTHLCLSLTADYFGISLGRLFRKTLPAVITTVLFTLVYYLVLTHLFNI